MDPTAILHADHQKFIGLFSQIEHAKPEDRRELYLRLELILTVHMLCEEKVFYHELLKEAKVTDVVRKSYQAHHLVDVATHELKLLPYNSEQWLPKFQAIRDNILSHMAEEENFLFPMLKQILTGSQLADIADKMSAYRHTLWQ